MTRNLRDIRFANYNDPDVPLDHCDLYNQEKI